MSDSTTLLPPLFDARFLRDDHGAINLFKQGAGLWSDELADPEDSVVEVALIVDSKPRYLVKYPVTREMANDISTDPFLAKGMQHRAAWYAARLIQQSERRTAETLTSHPFYPDDFGHCAFPDCFELRQSPVHSTASIEVTNETI